jgi:nucleotide-binding universal stress UspA family protein
MSVEDVKKEYEEGKSQKALVTYVHDDGEFSMLMDTAQFMQLQRVGAMYSSSKMVPENFRGDSASCALAVSMSIQLSRPGFRIDPLVLMQHMYLVHGRVGWEAKFLTALLNSSGLLRAPLEYEEKDAGKGDAWAIRGLGVDAKTGKEVRGPWISVALAKRMGWWEKKNKKGEKVHSLWPVMTEMMLHYRAASWFVNRHYPEVKMGLNTADELEDIADNGGHRVEVSLVDADVPASVTEKGPVVDAEFEEPAEKIQELAEKPKRKPRKKKTEKVEVQDNTGEPEPPTAAPRARKDRPVTQETMDTLLRTAQSLSIKYDALLEQAKTITEDDYLHSLDKLSEAEAHRLIDHLQPKADDEG